jgi:hypothetical protein
MEQRWHWNRSVRGHKSFSGDSGELLEVGAGSGGPGAASGAALGPCGLRMARRAARDVCTQSHPGHAALAELRGMKLSASGWKRLFCAEGARVPRLLALISYWNVRQGSHK